MVSNLTNIRYLTGFTGSNGFLLVATEGAAVFVTDGRYGEVAAGLGSRLPEVELIVYRSEMYDHLAGAIGALSQVDLEAASVSWDFVSKLGAKTAATLEPSTGVVERLRSVKDDDEVVALRRAAEVGDQAIATLDGVEAKGLLEREIGDQLVAAMRRQGAEAAGWPPIVAGGANAARPHHRAGTDIVGSGLLLVDYGCTVDGYHSDMSRTIWLGDESDAEADAVYAAVAEANRIGIETVAAGVEARTVDQACRTVLADAGYEELFVHSTGHGVGLDIHESPSVRSTSSDVLEAGNVVTIEPGVYIPGRFGVRIEDMVLVTEEGSEVLTTASKEFRPT